MLKSRIFLKAMTIFSLAILIYTLSLSFIIVPKIEHKIKYIEEKNAKETLKKVLRIVNNVNSDLKSFRAIYLEQQKKSLTNLTDSIYSILDAKYENSKFENIGNVLEEKAKEFEKNLMAFYNKNKNKMSKEELKRSIINFVNIYRYNNKRGYFWINDYNVKKIIAHPINHELVNLEASKIQNQNVKDVFNVIKKSVENKDSGISYYKWLNPISNKIEDKISYSFRFKPYDWVIGTGEYYEVLKEEIKKDVLKTISKIRYGENNYFFVLEYDGLASVHPYLQGKNIINLQNDNGSFIVQDMIELARKNSEAFYTYSWKKNSSTVDKIKKISFVKNFPNWNIVIGTGISLDVIDNEVKKRKKELITQLREIIDTTKFVKTGYLYVMSKEGIMLMHQNKNIEGKDVSLYVNPNNKMNTYLELVKAYNSKEKKFFYKWNKPSDSDNYIYDKVSWVEYIPDLQWYIASSIYVDELKEESVEIRNFIILLASFLLFILIVLSFFFFRKLLVPITMLSQLASKVTKGDYSKRYKIKNDDNEIEILAIRFNEMLDTIEYKTKDLEESNDELESTINNLKQTQDKLVEAEKMASLGSLVAGVAHEINTPVGIGITASSHFISLANELKDKYKKEKMSEKEFEDFLDDSNELAILIKSNLDRTALIINNFKQITVDQTSEQKREFNVNEYLEVVLLSIENRIKKKDIDIRISCPLDLKIDSYPGLLAQVITNLIINSYVHAFKEQDDAKININIERKNDNLIIEYKDNGCGIKKDHISKIFEPFFTTNRKEGGSGLGLNIIYNIVTSNLRGSVKCTSKNNTGVCFDIVIPI